jgi:hypothetical protein
MKLTKILLASIATAAAMTVASFAGDMVSNGHGQFVTLNRDTTPSIALFASGSGIGANPSSTGLQTESLRSGHGQSTVLYRAE